MKRWHKVLLSMGIGLGLLAAYVFVQIRSLTVESVTDDVYVIFGLGGNAGVLRTDAGTVIVDTMTLKYQGRLIRDRAEAITGQPVVLVINTHYHLDHTHGNPAFDVDTRVVATARTLHHMQTVDADHFDDPGVAGLPNEIFDGTYEIQLGGKSIQLVHAGRGHTDGDLVALFVEDQVLHTGDLFFNRLYPNIDLEAGGSIQAWGDTLEQVLKLPFNRVIPGHGPTSDRAGLMQFQQFVTQLAAVGRTAAESGWTLEQAQQTAEFTEDEGYDEIRMIIPVGLDRKFVLRRAWEESTRNFELRP